MGLFQGKTDVTEFHQDGQNMRFPFRKERLPGSLSPAQHASQQQKPYEQPASHLQFQYKKGMVALLEPHFFSLHLNNL